MQLASHRFTPTFDRRWLTWRRIHRAHTIKVITVSRKVSAQSMTAMPMDAALLRRLRRGDGDAWDALMAEWGPRLYSYMRYNLPTAEDAEDALSETFVAAVKSVMTFDGQVAVSTWLYSLAYRKVADFWRRSHHVSDLTETLAAPPIGTDLDFFEALNGVPEPARQALLLRYRDGLSVDEVATVLGRTYKATESLLVAGAACCAQRWLNKGSLMNDRGPDNFTDGAWRDLFRRLPDEPLRPVASRRVRAAMQAALDDLAQPASAERQGRARPWRPRLGFAATLILLNAVALVVAVLFVSLLGPVKPLPLNAVARVSGGTATIRQARTGNVAQVLPGAVAPLEPGDEITTDNATVSLTYFDGQVTTLMPNARAALAALARDNGGTQVELRLERGRAVSQLSKRLEPVDRFVIQSPSLATTVRGTEFTVEARSATETFVATKTGSVRVMLGDQEVIVNAGEEVVAVVGQPLNVRPSPTAWIVQLIMQWLESLRR